MKIPYRILLLSVIVIITFMSIVTIKTTFAAKKKDVEKKVSALIDQASKFGLQKKYDDAIVYFEEALKLDPQNADIFF